MSNTTASPAIVVVAYDRPNSLARLLTSLSLADYHGRTDIPLVISIDNGDNHEVREHANKFPWIHGDKRVIVKTTNMGMRNHSISCADLTEQYGSVVFLEDDTYVAPQFYDYAIQALDFYSNQDYVAGVSLYGYLYNEITGLNFTPIQDGYDNYFVQSANTWGVLWNRTQWRHFIGWLEEFGNVPVTPRDNLPSVVTSWGPTSWKKYINKYLAKTNKYYVYPRTALLTNFSDPGSHSKRGTNNLQVSLLLGRRKFLFSSISQSLSVYDAFFELDANCLKQMNPSLKKYDLEVDLYGLKYIRNSKREYLLTSRNCSSHIRAFGCKLFPAELNCALNIPGHFFYLAKKDRCTNHDSLRKIRLIKHAQKQLGLLTYFLLLFDSIRVFISSFNLKVFLTKRFFPRR